jgi:hypothetical protein
MFGLYPQSDQKGNINRKADGLEYSVMGGTT